MAAEVLRNREVTLMFMSALFEARICVRGSLTGDDDAIRTPVESVKKTVEPEAISCRA